MKLLEKTIYAKVLMIIMALWFVPMNYGHEADIPISYAAGTPGPDTAISNGLDTNWYDARATFYGDIYGRGTEKGACGYGDLNQQGYGLATAALSPALFNNGYTCGACYQIICVHDPQWCLPGTLKITATNLCPANYTKTTDIWCNPPQKHFDLSQPMFLKIAQYRAGVVPVKYRRVHCSKIGGVKFETRGKPYFLMILPYNVGGAGDIVGMQIQGDRTAGWINMSKNWGQNWVTGVNFTGQSLSFRVRTSDDVTKDFINVVPNNCGFDQTFDGKINF